MAFTNTDVNGWLATIDGLSGSDASPVPDPFLTTYVTDLNTPAPPATPTSTPAQIQANLENFPFNSAPPPTNVVQDTFYRTEVADFVLREFQLAWGTVPTSGSATSQYDAWVARIIANPSIMTNGAMSEALAGTTQFMVAIGATSPTQAATTGMINALCANAGVAVGAGALANVGLPIWEVLQNFAESQKVTNSLAAPIANFQNLLLAGGTAPSGSILTLPGTGGASLTLTTGVDSPTQGFSGHGATATTAGAVFSAQPGSNSLGLSNTLNAGDDLEATGLAAGNSTLNYTAVLPSFGNPSTAPGVTMNGVSAAIITSLNPAGSGFSGTITGLTAATVAAGSVGDVTLGMPGDGLNTALKTVTINASVDFTGNMTPAALAAAPTGTVTLNGPVTTIVTLDSGGAATGYSALTVNSAGPAGTTANNLTLDIGAATNTATITATGAEFLTLQGTALNIDHLHTFTGNGTTPDTGGLDVIFTNNDGLGHVAATGGSGVNTFEFDATTAAALGGAGLSSFTSTSSVNGGTGTTNTLIIDATHGAVLLTGDGPNITNIATVEHSGVQNGTPITADLALIGSATTFDLAGDYNALVTVSDITDAQTLEYSGTSVAGADLVLVHATPVISTNVINFEMNSSLTGPLTLTELDVAAGLKALNIDSTGSASANVITDVSHILDNITVTGGTPLQLGDSVAHAYGVATGTIDASGTTGAGGVTAWLAPTPGSATAQTFVAGPAGTTNLANLVTGGGGVIDFSHGGTDTVQFSSGTAAGNPIADTAHNYNFVAGFTTGPDSINISVGSVVTAYTDTGLAVQAGDATHAFNFTTGTSVVANSHSNLIDITTPITSTPAETAQNAFHDAIGTAVANGITVGNAAIPYLLSFYDNTTSEAVVAIATPATTLISNVTPITVVGLIHESAADYAHIASNLHFVA